MVPQPVDWTPPERLTGRALYEWRRIVSHLEEHKIGRNADKTAVEAASRLWELFLSAMDAVDRDGLSATCIKWPGKNASPAVKVALDTIAQLRQLWGSLGMTPDSRYRIKAASEDDKSKIVADWLYGAEEDRPLGDHEDY